MSIKRSLKKGLSLLLAILVVTSLLPINANAALITEHGFFMDDRTGIIQQYTGGERDVVIPDTILGVPVKGIGHHAFVYNHTTTNSAVMTNLTISSNIESITEYAFFSGLICMPNVESVTFKPGSKLKTIGNYSFYSMLALSSIVIPASTVSIGQEAFGNCPNIKSIVFEEGSVLEKIGIGAFAGTQIAELKMPASVLNIAKNAFANCTALGEVTIWNPETEIANDAFKGAAANLTVFGYYGSTAEAHAEENGYNFVPLPSAEADFAIDTNGIVTGYFGTDTKVVIPSSINGTVVTDIGANAFIANADNITSVTIPATATSIGKSAFEGCTLLESVGFAKGSQIETIGECAFAGTALNSLALPTSVKTVGAELFKDCESLASVTLGGVTELSFGMFDGCTSLESIVIPYSVTAIGDKSFYGSGLTEVEIFSLVKNIGANAFANCGALTSVRMLNSSAAIHDTAFAGFTGTMYGYSNSTAQAYAAEHGINFVEIEREPATRITDIIITGDQDYDMQTNLVGKSFTAGSLTAADGNEPIDFNPENFVYDYYVNVGTKYIDFDLSLAAKPENDDLRIDYVVGGISKGAGIAPDNNAWRSIRVDLTDDATEALFTVRSVDPDYANDITTYTVNIIRHDVELTTEAIIWAAKGYYSGIYGDREWNTAVVKTSTLYINKGITTKAVVDYSVTAGSSVTFADGSTELDGHTIERIAAGVISGPGKRVTDVYRISYNIANNIADAPPSVPSVRVETEGSTRTFTVSLKYRTERVGVFTPDRIVSFGQGETSQFQATIDNATGVMVGKGAVMHYVSLGGLGGQITVAFDEPIRNDPNQPYGVDFVVIGNAFAAGGFPEAASCEVSQDGKTWYYLAGTAHYEALTKLVAVEAFTTTLCISNKVPAAGDVMFGYGDVAGCSMNANGEGTYYPTGEPRNPYLTTLGIGDVMDISWAVDETGKPVYLDEINYVRLQNAVVASDFGGVSPEIGTILKTDNYRKNEAYPLTAAPMKLMVAGVDILSLEPTEAQPNGDYYELDVSGGKLSAVVTEVEAQGANIYINNKRSDNSGKNTVMFATSSGSGLYNAAGEAMVRVIVQNGENQPRIYVIKVKGGDVAAARANAELDSIVLMPGGASMPVNEAGVYIATVDGDTLTAGFIVNALNPSSTMRFTDKNGSADIEHGAQNTTPLLAVGENKFTVTVRSEDGNNTNEYKIIITREEPEPIPEGEAITVTLTVEQLTLNKGFVVEPVSLTVRKGTTAAQALEILLATNGIAFKYTGSVKNAFYLAGIRVTDGDVDGDGWLGEKETGYKDSGWMFTLNNRYPELGSSECILSDGDVLRWQFTLYNGDLGVDGDNLGVNLKANKDQLIKKIAQINAAGTVAEYGDTYGYALDQLKKLNATSGDINSMLAALTGKDPADPTALQDAISSANSLVSSIESDGGLIGTAPGQYPQAAVNTLKAAIATAITRNTENATQAELDEAAATLEAALKVFSASKVTFGSFYDVYDDTISKIKGQTGNPVVGSVGGEWAVIALARAYPNEGGEIKLSDAIAVNYLNNLRAKLNGKPTGPVRIKDDTPTENERVILALTALGIDAASFEGYDFVTPLTDTVWVTSQGVNSSIFALLALDSKPYTVDASVRAALRADILANQSYGIGGLTNVGWTSGANFEPDMTAMALQALAPHRGEPGVDAAITNGLSGLAKWLEITDYNDAGSESYSQIIVALTALGTNPNARTGDFAKNGESILDHLLKYAMANGSFQHISSAGGNTMATEQAGYALAAYDRYRTNGATTLYDMSDRFEIPDNEPSQDELDTQMVATAKQAVSGASSVWTTSTVNTQSGIQSWIQGEVNSLGLDAAAIVNVSAFSAAVDGTVLSKSGTDGSYTAVINISKGNISDSVTVSGTIPAEDFVSSDTGITSVSVDGRGGAIDGTRITVVLPYTTTELPQNSGAITIVTTDAGATIDTPQTSDDGATWTFTVTAEDGITTEVYTINVSIAANSNEGNAADISVAKSVIESKEWTADADTDVTQEWLENELNALSLNGVGFSVTTFASTDAIAGDADNTSGINGSFTATVALTKGEDEETETGAAQINGTILAKPYADEADSQKTLESITVTPPTKLTYALGERLSDSGLVVMAIYSDDSSEVVTEYTITPDFSDRLLTAGTQNVTVEYQGKTAVFDVTVNEADKTELVRQIGLAPTANTSGWSTNTYNVLVAALRIANETNDNANATQSNVDVAAATLKDAIANLQVVTGSNQITVRLWLIGSTYSSGDVDLQADSGNFKGAKYVTWIPTTEYTLQPGSTVYDLLMAADGTRGLSMHVRDQNNYLDYIYAPTVVGGYKLGEFSTGPQSGWMYTRNGYHPGLGINEQALSNGDIIVFHYVNDHRYETNDTPDSLGSTYANLWLNAANRWPTENDGNPDGATNNPGNVTGGNGTPGSVEIGDEKTPLADMPANSVEAELEAKVDGEKASADVDIAKISEMIADANTDSKTNLTLTVTETGSAATIELDLLIGAINDIVKNNMSLTVQTDNGTVIFDTASLKAIADGKGATEKVRIVIDLVDTASDTLTTAQKAIVDSNPVINLTVWVGNTQIHDFKGTVTVKLPKLPNDITAEDYDLLTVYYLANDGSIQEMTDANYDASSNSIIFTTDHFSFYFVAEWINPFEDISKTDWFYRNVRFAYRNDLMNGTAAGVFSAQMNLTRAQLITILARQAGIDTTGGATWYSKAWEWAVSVELTDGTNPEGIITREQMVTMLYRYAKLQGKSVSKTVGLDGYTDAKQVSGWAADAAAWAVANGLMTGRTATTLVPDGTATRAETSALLQRFIENIR